MTAGSILGFLTLGLVATTMGIDLTVGSGPLKSGFLTATFVCLGIGFIFVVVRNGLVPYVLKRLLEAAGVMFLIVSATFVLLRYLPGGPFDSEKALPPEIKANIEAKYNLNAPLYVQYGDYLKKLAHGDLGVSYKYVGRPVTEMILSTLPNSFQLGFYALLVSFCLGIPMGVFAANRHNTWADTLTMTTAMSGVALPSFLVAPILILIFSYWLGWLPPALWGEPVYYVLPVVTLGIRPAAIIARLTRSSVLDVIHADYVRTAKAKGLSHSVVLYKHVLRNSLLPVVTIAGPLTASLLSGAFVIEFIYAIPGMGQHFISSVSNRDYPVVLGSTLVFAGLLVIANLIVDLLYSIVDPRIRLS